jgi:hypothetical protein
LTISGTDPDRPATRKLLPFRGAENGAMTARYETDIPFASAIALQHHTTEVRFRNIRIRPL